MPLETFPLDLADLVPEREGQEYLLEEAFASGHADLIANALGIVARARGMTATAQAAGVTREALHKALSSQGNPTLATLLGVTKALGYRLKLVPLTEEAHAKAAE